MQILIVFICASCVPGDRQSEAAGKYTDDFVTEAADKEGNICTYF